MSKNTKNITTNVALFCDKRRLRNNIILRNSKIILYLFIIIALTITSNASTLIRTNKLNYNVNEQVSIRLNTPSTLYNIGDLELSINAPTNHFKYLGLTENLIFYPHEEGIYSLILSERESIIDKTQFSVGENYANIFFDIETNNNVVNTEINNSEINILMNNYHTHQDNLKIILPKKEFYIGEIIQINFTQNLTEYTINIQSPSNNFQYLGIPSTSIIFIGQEIGDYVINIVKDTHIISTSEFRVVSRYLIDTYWFYQNNNKFLSNNITLIFNNNHSIQNETILFTTMHDKNSVYIIRKSDFIKEKKIVDKINTKKNYDNNTSTDDFVTYKVGIIGNKSFLNLSKWNDEVQLSIVDNGTFNEVKEFSDGVSFLTTQYETKIYEIPNGIEYEQVFTSKPPSNVITLKINAENLKFYFQGPLNVTQNNFTNCNETDCWDDSRKIKLHRPINIVNSYAVYHSSKKNDNYKTGKAFHIYRPRIIDANNDSVWGMLNIDTDNNKLTISIPQNFLDNAVYPVVVDPTFGYDVAGSSFTTNPTSAFADIKSTYTASSGDVLTRYFIYASSDTSGASVKMGVYDDDSGTPRRLIHSGTVSLDKDPNWYSLESLSESLSDGTLYYVAFQDTGDGKNDIYYDDTPGDFFDSECADGLIDTWSETGKVEYRYSIYAVVESGGGVSDNPPSSLLVSPGDGTVSTNTSYTFRCNAADDIKINNVTLRIWNSTGGVYYNFTNTTSSIGNVTYNFSVSNLIVGSYSWNCLVFDNSSAGQSAWSLSNYTLTVKSVPSVVLSTPFNGNVTGVNNITFVCNVTSYEYGIRNVSLFTNISGVWAINQTVNISTSCSINNISGYYNVTVNPDGSCSIFYQPNETYGVDTYVYQYYPTTNFGSNDNLFLRQYSSLQSDILLWFNLSVLPVGSYVSGGNLSLYYYSGAGVDNNLNTSPYKITQSWSESSVNWNNRPSYTTQMASAVSLQYSSYGWMNWFFNTAGLDVINNWVSSPDNNFGIYLSAPYVSGGGPYRYFYSSNYSTVPSYRPKLSLNYNSFIMNSSVEFNVSGIPDGNYVWNCRVYDTNTDIWWAPNNYTFTVNTSVSNSVPNTPLVVINSNNGLNTSDQDLNCVALITDNDSNTRLNVTVNWSRNGIWNLSIDYNNSYMNGTVFNATLGKDNTTRNDVWSCSMRLFDGYNYGEWGDSDTITILNTLPTQTNPIITPDPTTTITNITCNNQSTFDEDADTVTNIFNWLKNNVSTTVLVMPFDTNVTSNASGSIKDYSGFGNTGTLGNNSAGTLPVWNNSCKLGGCYLFDGIDDMIIVNNSVSLHGNNSWAGLTIEAWVKPYNISTARGIVSMRVDPIDASFNMGFDSAGSGNQLFCGFYLNSTLLNAYTEALAAGTNTLSVDVWHHVVCVLNNGVASSYVDGVLQHSNASYNSTNFKVRGSSAKLRIGARGNGINVGDRSFNGFIDEVRIYNHSLSLDEILVHNETGYNRLVTKEFALNDNLTCEVTPNDAFGDGNTLRENTTILEGISIDIWTNSTYISLGNNTPPAELENILINTTIFNSGTSNASNVIIQFYDGDPALNGIQIGSNITVNISANSNVTINTSWIASVGTHYIFVTIDSDNNISETNEDNNIANKSITISSWVVYYGKINTTIYLTNNQNSSFIKWLGENVTGNIYISDSDTDNGISWTTLKPIWQNTTGYNNSDTINDFEEIDSLLGLENNTDSINKTFTLNNIPKNFDNFNIFSISLVNVSIDNSTNTSNFITGVLWDSSDSSNSYYDITDKEDIIFVTKINKNKDGKYGIYDYEIKIPGFLRDYKGTNANVDLYYEIN